MKKLWQKISSWFKEKLGFSPEGAASSWLKAKTGAGLTDAEVQANDMQMQNQEDVYQRQVTGMQKAGLNPALMYQSGAGASAPSVSSSQNVGSGANMSELLQLTMLPLQRKLIQAQVENVNADSQKKIADTEHVKQVMEFYPRLTEANISKLASSMGLDLANINKIEAETAIAEFEKIIKSAEADNAPALYKARVALEEAKTEAEKARAASDLAQAAWTEYETNYTKAHDGARPSSSSTLALIDAVSSWLGVKLGSEEQKSVIGKVVEDFKNPVGYYKKGIEQGKQVAKKAGSWIGRKYRQFSNWANREKRIKLF